MEKNRHTLLLLESHCGLDLTETTISVFGVPASFRPLSVKRGNTFHGKCCRTQLFNDKGVIRPKTISWREFRESPIQSKSCHDGSRPKEPYARPWNDAFIQQMSRLTHISSQLHMPKPYQVWPICFQVTALWSCCKIGTVYLGHDSWFRACCLLFSMTSHSYMSGDTNLNFCMKGDLCLNFCKI